MQIEATTIDRLISTAEQDAQKASTALSLLRQLRDLSTQPKPRQPRKPMGITRPGFVTTLIPTIRSRGGRMQVKTMLEELHRVPEYKHVTRESLEATLSGEMKRSQPRLARIAPGTYALLETTGQLRDEVLAPRAA